MFAYSFNDFLYNKIIYIIITKISSKTFYIYLIHIFVINSIFKAYNIDQKFHKNSKSIKGHFKYQIYSVFFIFFIYIFIIFNYNFFIKKIHIFCLKLFFKKVKYY